ncbi:MAG: hypothetical protein BLM47_11975 [Candidatus Reconcilbacillus cellulovorans]|uniref:Uncharacterized protein n=1 Tax=Candidatus Reconcilbacillus cellulovorans TaxID=1906605 RepID=A0A2A6DXM5_9BACL|nr:MAG: hypothetical protein BLM47_11975 [Candidatus Reconcilbacillus cellulovorans]
MWSVVDRILGSRTCPPGAAADARKWCARMCEERLVRMHKTSTLRSIACRPFACCSTACLRAEKLI